MSDGSMRNDSREGTSATAARRRNSVACRTIRSMRPPWTRQRVAIARALVTDPRILIFDEATSALDYESERIIQRNMRRICRGRTVLIIAHRLSTVRGADRIVTIERGEIVEDGTHEELVGSGGRYARLWRIQSGDIIDAAD